MTFSNLRNFQNYFQNKLAKAYLNKPQHKIGRSLFSVFIMSRTRFRVNQHSKWMSVRLRTKRPWVLVSLQSLKSLMCNDAVQNICFVVSKKIKSLQHTLYSVFTL